MAADIILAVALMGLVIFIGFLGDEIFKRTGVPSVILLLLLGLIIGPGLNLINSQDLFALSNLFAAVAIIIILFDGGLGLDLYQVLKGASKGTILAVSSFLISIIVVMTLTLAIGFDMYTGILLGAILGGSSSAIVIPLVNKIKGVNQETKTILSLESALTDALGVVVVIALIQGALLGTGILEASQNLASAFSIGAVIGLMAGMTWIQVIRKIQDAEHSYIITIALAFVLYAIVELLKGSGAIAMLMFGLVLGNGRAIHKILRYKHPFELSKAAREFNSLITFFVTTFFFVYMGILVKFNDLGFILFGVIVVIAITVMRPTAVGMLTKKETISSKTMSIMIPRGLAAAVLAFLPLSAGIPNTHWFPDVVFTVILGTTLVTTIGAFKVRQASEKIKK